MKNVYIHTIGSLIYLLVACQPLDTITVDRYDNHKKIIYGRIDKKITFDDQYINNFLSQSEKININCKDCLYKAERIKIDFKRNVIKLQQYYKDYKVFGHTVVLHTDPDNNPVYVIDHTFPVDGSFLHPDKIISESEALKLLLKYLNSKNVKLKPAELGIVTYTEKPLLRYRVKAFIPERPFDGGTFDIDAVTGEIVRYEPALISTKVSITNTNNENVDVEVAKNPDEYSDADCADNYCAVDTTRGTTEVFSTKFIKTYYEIQPAQWPGELPPSSMLFSSGEASIWDGVMPDGVKTRRIEGISAHYAAQRIYDWYASLGLKGIVNKENGFRVYLEKMAYDPLGLNAFWDIYSHSAMVLWVYQPDENTSRSFASSYDVVGHEYTHGVLSAPLSEGGLAELEYNNSNYPKNESASVQEGLCDTMGSLSQGDENPNWLLGYNGLIDSDGRHRWLRNNSDPYDADALTWGDKEYIGQCYQRFCSKYPPPDGHKDTCKMPWDSYDSSYVCATTISHPAWKIKNSIGIEKTARIYFNVIDKYLQKKELIPTVSQYVFDSCMELYNNNDGECCAVFRALTESKFTINTRGVVCSEPVDAGPDVTSDVVSDISSDAPSDVIISDIKEDVSIQDAIMDVSADISDFGLEDFNDIVTEDILVTDEIADNLEILDTTEDTVPKDNRISEDAEEDAGVITDISQVIDSGQSKSEESSEGCSCSVIE